MNLRDVHVMEADVKSMGEAWDMQAKPRMHESLFTPKTGKGERKPTLFERYREEGGNESFGAWLRQRPALV